MKIGESIETIERVNRLNGFAAINDEQAELEWLVSLLLAFKTWRWKMLGPGCLFKFIFCCMALGLWLLSPTKAGAQQLAEAPTAKPTRTTRLLQSLQTSTVKLDMQQKSLSDMVDTLATLLHCNILVDDEPLLTTANVKFEGTGKDALDIVVDTFDYTWQTSNSGGVLLRKRFRNPLEHPQLNYLEMRQMARDAVTVLSVLQTDPRNLQEQWTFTLHHLYDTFTPEQRQTLLDGKKLTMQQLAEPQRALVERTVYGNAFEPLCIGWLTLEEFLDAMPLGWLQLDTVVGTLPGQFTIIGRQSEPVRIDFLNYRYWKRGGGEGGITLKQESHARSKEKQK